MDKNIIDIINELFKVSVQIQKDSSKPKSIADIFQPIFKPDLVSKYLEQFMAAKTYFTQINEQRNLVFIFNLILIF